MLKFLIVIADFYEHLAALQLQGAAEELTKKNVHYDIIKVPGALEIPGVIANASLTGIYQGYIALGCVIRGETYHFEIVCNESARGLMELATEKHLAIGNGILTVENEEQARIRVDPKQLNKGGGAALAAVRMVEIKQQLGIL